MPTKWMPVIGALGGITAAALTFTLASGHGGGPMRLTLCGIAVGAVLNALSLGLIAGWGSQRLEVVMRWMSGNLYARGWDDLRFLVLTTLPLLLPLGFIARPLELAGFRADLARAWGLNWSLWYPALIALASMLAATAAGTTGPLLFVGLMAPHLARWLWRSQGPAPVAVAVIVGALLVTLADLAGRLIGGAEEIPVGIVTALVGAPILLVQLRREVPA